MEKVSKKLKELLIAYGIDQSKVSEESDYYYDLNLNMLDLMEFAGYIKNEFSVKIPDNEIYRMEKISDTIVYLNNKRGLSIVNI